MDTAIDRVLQGLVALAEQGTHPRIAMQVDGLVVIGTLISAAAYHEALTALIGQSASASDPTDTSFLHLRDASLPASSGRNELYRCRISAVRSYVVFGA